jgi:hypothetical protein
MLRILNRTTAVIAAVALTFSLGACGDMESASNTMNAEDVTNIEDVLNADLNADAENMSTDMNMIDANAVMIDANVAENAGEAVENAGNLIEPPATDTGPDDLAEEGVGAFRDPGDMEVDKWYQVEFFVAPDKPETQAAEELADVSEGVALTTAQPVFVAPIMRVTLLEDPNFEIRAKGDAIRTTGRDMSASWQWDVKPLTGGDRTLFAKVEVLRRLPDGSYEATETKTRRVAFSVEVGTWNGLLIALRNAATLGDLLATLFGSWRGALVALTALIVAASGLWLAIRNWGKSKA